MREKKDPADWGTVELGRRFKIVPVMSSPGTMTGKVMSETEIDRLLFEDIITANEHATLGVLMKRLMKANFVGMRSPSLEAPVQTDPSIIADKKANLIRSVNKLFVQLDRKMGSRHRVALVNLVILDQPWPWDHQGLKECISHLESVL